MGKAQQWSDSPRLVRMYRFVIKWSVPQQKSNTTHIPPFPFSPSLHLMPLLLDLWLSDSFEKITSHCSFPSASLASPFCPPPPSFFSSSWPSCQTSGGRLAGRGEMVSGSVLWIQFQSWLCEETAGHRGSGGFRPVLFCSFPPPQSQKQFPVFVIFHTLLLCLNSVKHF